MNLSPIHEIGYSKTYEITVTREMVDLFAKTTGDFNPIHMDEEFAKKTQFGRCIAHGILTVGFFSRCLVETWGIGIYLAQDVKFVNPVYIDDTILVSVTLTGLRGEKMIGTVETVAKRKSNGDLCAKGQAMIMMSSMV